MQETKNLSYISMLKGYKQVFWMMICSSKMRLVVYFMALTNIIQITTGNFFSLYITEALGISDAIVAVFPIIRTFIMLLFVIGLQNVFHVLPMKSSFFIGFSMYVVSHVLLLLSPEKNLFFIVGYTILETTAYAVIIPRKDALMAHYVDARERSRIYALYNVLMIALSTPFGSIIGWMYDISPRVPFFIQYCTFFLCFSLTYASKDLTETK